MSSSAQRPRSPRRDLMTILRLPGADQLATATRLATEDDASVAGGLLAVTVRWWQPMMVAKSWS